jgi:hypothetical protein
LIKSSEVKTKDDSLSNNKENLIKGLNLLAISLENSDQLKKMPSLDLKQKFKKYLFYENRTCYFISPKYTTWDESRKFCKNILNNSYSDIYEYENGNEFNKTIARIREIFQNITQEVGFHIGFEMNKDSKFHFEIQFKAC